MTIWDTSTEKVVRDFGKLSHGTEDYLTLSPDGKSIATSGNNDPKSDTEPDIVLWETATGQERLRIVMNEGQLTQIVFSPDGRLLAAVGRTETIRLWDAWTGKALGHFKGHRGWMSSLAFAPDGKTLASGGADSTVLIWDVSGLPPAHMPAAPLDGDALAKCWEQLAAKDAAQAYQAIAELTRRPSQAEGLIEGKLADHPGMNAKQLALLIADLDANDFKTREKATKALADMGKLAEGSLTKALEGKPGFELQQRVHVLLKKLEGQEESPHRRLLLRAIEVLDRLGTPEARRLLGKLEQEATEPEVAQQAKASLERLDKAKRIAP
jgi:hypothetical protein